MTESPKRPDQRRAAQAPMIAHYRRDGGKMVGVERVPKPENESPRKRRYYRRIHDCSVTKLGLESPVANDTMSKRADRGPRSRPPGADGIYPQPPHIVVIGKGMKQSRKTTTARIAIANLAFPRGSSSITGG